MKTLEKNKWDVDAEKIGKMIHKRGHWGHHGNGDNGWVGYVIVLGICIVAFLTVGLLN